MFHLLSKGDGKELASKLWNVTAKATFESVVCDTRNEFVVSYDVGLAGHVAVTRESLNVSNVYEVSVSFFEVFL